MKYTIATLLLCGCLCLAGCAGGAEPENGGERADMTETETEQRMETEAEAEAAEVVLSPERRIDFTAWDDALLSLTFPASAATEVSLCPDGIQLTARTFTTDPQVRFDIDTLYGALGYAETESGSHVPFSPEEAGAIAVKLRCAESGIFEFFYAAGEIAEATAGYAVTEAYAGGDGWQYLLLDCSGAAGYHTRFRDHCRLDWSAAVQAGDGMTIAELLFFPDTDTAQRYLAQNGAVVQSAMARTGYGTAEMTGSVAAGYYVCHYQNKRGTADAGVLEVFST